MSSKNMSPMMQEYCKTKEKYKDCVLFYRLGDFYEMFFDDALLVSKELELTLTGKDCGLEERAPMCGIPFHASEVYIKRLIEKGHKVAICEQVEDPKKAKGLVKREVIRVVTPGTTLDATSLDESKNNYLMSIVSLEDHFGCAIADITTGDCFLTEVDRPQKLLDEINKFVPAVLKLVPDSLREAAYALGTPKWKMISAITLKASVSGIMTGILLAIARIAGETAPLLFTALSNQFWSTDMMQPIANLPVTIFKFAMSPFAEWQQLAWAGVLIITLCVLLLNILARVVFAKNKHG